jgi:hypothetical protein
VNCGRGRDDFPEMPRPGSLACFPQLFSLVYRRLSPDPPPPILSTRTLPPAASNLGAAGTPSILTPHVEICRIRNFNGAVTAETRVDIRPNMARNRCGLPRRGLSSTGKDPARLGAQTTVAIRARPRIQEGLAQIRAPVTACGRANLDELRRGRAGYVAFASEGCEEDATEE